MVLSPDQLREALDAAFPRTWREILERRVPFYRALSEAEQERFEDQIQRFVLTKTFTGHGLEITDEMKVVVAAAACRLTLNLPWLEYAHVQHVNLRAERAWHEGSTRLVGTGSGWHVTLSWPTLVRDLELVDDGRNVGYHEFAHALDGADGSSDGEVQRPPGGPYACWTAVITSARAEVVRAVRAGVAPPIDKYAGKNDAELFAVATEWFFERPGELRAALPALYELLRDFYHQDPAARLGGAP